MVTWRSCIASRSADCTLAGARFISSARIKLANIGPFFTEKVSFLGLYICVPIISAGNKSGVNCKRLNFASIVLASVLMASVFANPGTPSNRICPLESNATKRRSLMCFCPTITLLSSSISISIIALSLFIFSFNSFKSVCTISVILYFFSECKFKFCNFMCKCERYFFWKSIYNQYSFKFGRGFCSRKLLVRLSNECNKE